MSKDEADIEERLKKLCICKVDEKSGAKDSQEVRKTFFLEESMNS
jgi:hypothetical protein